jgi:hypothetical protein
VTIILWFILGVSVSAAIILLAACQVAATYAPPPPPKSGDYGEITGTWKTAPEGHPTKL